MNKIKLDDSGDGTDYIVDDSKEDVDVSMGTPRRKTGQRPQ
jgi:hypothetical protein